MAAPLINDRYAVVRRLGAGGHGTVWLVTDQHAGGARRALKLVRAPDAERRDQLSAEFARLTRLSHPNLLRVYDLEHTVAAVDEIEAGSVFFTAEFVAGEDPVSVLARAPVSQRTALALDVVEQIAEALAHVHAAGLVHCDVKPANIAAALTDDGMHAVLLDLGVSDVRGLAGEVRGTPAYMPPEALAGTVDPRGDLYSLGATLHEMLSGRRAFPQTGPALVRAICDGTRAPCHSTWAPASLVRLAEQLLSPALTDRPSSAAVVLDDVARIREAHGLARDAARPRPPASLLPPRLVGRDTEIGALLDALNRIGTAHAGRVLELVGPPGVGKRAVISEALRRHQLRVAAERAQPVTVIRGDTGDVETALARRTDERPPASEVRAEDDADAQRALLRWANDQVRRARALAAHNHRLALVVDDATDERRASLVAAFEADAELAGCLLIATDDTDPPEQADTDGGTTRIPVRPLAAEHIALIASSMLGRPAAPPWVSQLATACGGLPRLATEAIRAAAAEAGVDGADSVAVASLTSTKDALSELLVRRVASLTQSQASVMEALAVHGGAATRDALATTADIPMAEVHAAGAELRTRQLLVDGERVLRLPSRAHTEALHTAIPAARRRALHRAALRWWQHQPTPDPIAVADHLAVTGPAKRTVEAAHEAADVLIAAGRPLAALSRLERAADVASGTAAADIGLRLAQLYNDTGAYDAAIACAERATRSRDKHRRMRAQLTIARANQKRGDLGAAEASLAKLLSSHGTDEEVRGAYARVLVSRGAFERASAIASAPPAHDTPTRGTALRLEALALARLYLEDIDGATGAVNELESVARDSQITATLGKAVGLRGMVAQWSGDFDQASTLYAAAHETAVDAGDLHAAAVYALNRGAVCSDRARYGEALVALDAALRSLRRIGRVAELAGAVFNRGIALLRLGELDAARRSADEARRLAREHDTPQWEVFANLLDGDVARREGTQGRAEASYGAALEGARALGNGRHLLHALVNMAELRAELGHDTADALLNEARDNATTDEDRDTCTLAAARVALALARDEPGLAAQLTEAAARMANAGSHHMAWRCNVVAARLAHAQGDSSAATAAARKARATFDDIVAATQEARRAGLQTDPDAVALRWLEGQLPEARPGLAATETATTAAPREREFRRLLALSRRLNSELRLAPLLNQVMDTVVDLTGAERGFLLLRNADSNELEVVVARNFEQSELAGDELQVSRSIAERAAQTGDAVLTVDAGIDERFGGSASVAALRLRSVLALPLTQKGRITGTIYVDHRFRRGVFDEDAIQFMRELADIAAIAIENARLVDENRRRAAEIAKLNQQLAQEVTHKEAELANARARLEDQPRGALRHDYAAIVGRSPAMRDMLRIVDRATETDLPVVILGESGTGKELVARALHRNGSRRGEAFVAINCGAVPEALLESELFGHARGAFTGAARDRPGLFEVATGGTLLLDEIADTSLAMQTKLLRVLQEGEIRRVGESRTRAVDVRVIAASNRDLRHMVDAGQFREDLYYRLEVLRIEVPPLRERVEDIPDLARHILDRTGHGGTEASLTRAALAKLSGHAWPGNVRELENELVRAAALSGGRIDVDDLSPRIAAVPAQAPSATTPAAENLLLKPQVEALERALVEQALAKTHGNQTQAAKLLGLSRYGLQKKLKRYGIAGSV